MWRTLSLLLVVTVGFPAASQPAAQEAKLTAADAAGGDQFGKSVSLSGERALIGAFRDNEGLSDNGSAYVFMRTGDTWTQDAKLIADDAAAGDLFGHSVSLSGDRALIGAIDDDDGGNASGSAYVFVHTGDTWTQEAKLVADDAAASDDFGTSVSLSGDRALVGSSFNNGGSAYVFVRTGDTWVQEAKLTADDAEAGDLFGASVSLSGDRALIGGFGDDDAGESSGAAYVFVRSGGTWTQEAKLTADDAATFDQFGVSVSLLDERALVGAYLTDDGGSDSGSAYVFVRSGNTWEQEAKLTADDAAALDRFGVSVSLSGERALIGANFDSDAASFGGSAYVFVRSGDMWTQETKLTADDAEMSDLFGQSVSLSGDRALIGAVSNDDFGSDTGSAYVFSGLAPVASEPGVTSSRLALSVAPNPAHGTTSLILQLPSSVEAHIAAYDVLGRRVALLHNGPLTAGTHTFSLDTAGLPAGVYVVRATAGTSAVTQQFTLIR